MIATNTNIENFINNTETMLHLHNGTNRRLAAVSVGVPRRETWQMANEIAIAITLAIVVKIQITSANFFHLSNVCTLPTHPTSTKGLGS